MKLNRESCTDSLSWPGVRLPEYQVEQVVLKTTEQPVWLHFGAGNIFRAFPAVLCQRLLNQGKSSTGIVVAESFDPEIIERVYRPFDNLSLSVVLKSDGSIEREVVASVTESLIAQRGTADWERLEEVFQAPSLQMVSFTITEKGYAFWGEQSLMAQVAALLYRRYQAGATPLALVSMDNCSQNGEKLRQAIRNASSAMGDEGFQTYLEQAVSYPWSMIDKITPRPDEKVQHMLQETGLEDCDLCITEKNTYTASFVNAEEAGYLVIEDAFPNGRPPLEQAGVYFTNRETVSQVERMKVCTCLNPLHTALAVFGCLLGHRTIWEEMQDDDLRQMVEILGKQEGMPVVAHQEIVDPEAFLQEVLQVRLPNSFLPDTPQRIATDTSQKLAIRFGETIKLYEQSKDLRVERLRIIPLVFAAWIRYLQGVDDQGGVFEPSADPKLSELSEIVSGITPENVHEKLLPLLQDTSVFGVDLTACGLDQTVEMLFLQMCTGSGTVRQTLQKVLADAREMNKE